MVPSKKQRIIGWALSILIALFLMGPSAMGKFMEWDGKEKMLEQMGFSTDLLFKIGILEVALAALFLIPRTSFVAAIPLTGYLGGATLTHLRLNEPFFMPIVIGVVLWVAYGLRAPQVFSLALGKSN